MDRYVCMACEFEHGTDEESPVCPKCGGTMVPSIDRREAFGMIERFLEWSQTVDAQTAMETLMFMTVVESKNRGVPSAYYVRRLLQKWQQCDVALGEHMEIAEA